MMTHVLQAKTYRLNFLKECLHISSTALVSPSSSTNFQPTNETMKMSRQQLLQQQFGYFPTNHLVAEKHEPLRCVAKTIYLLTSYHDLSFYYLNCL